MGLEKPLALPPPALLFGPSPTAQPPFPKTGHWPRQSCALPVRSGGEACQCQVFHCLGGSGTAPGCRCLQAGEGGVEVGQGSDSTGSRGKQRRGWSPLSCSSCCPSPSAVTQLPSAAWVWGAWRPRSLARQHLPGKAPRRQPHEVSRNRLRTDGKGRSFMRDHYIAVLICSPEVKMDKKGNRFNKRQGRRLAG